MKDDDFKLLRGFGDGRTNGRTDICDCRVAFATENSPQIMKYFEQHWNVGKHWQNICPNTLENIDLGHRQSHSLLGGLAHIGNPLT